VRSDGVIETNTVGFDSGRIIKTSTTDFNSSIGLRIKNIDVISFNSNVE